MQLDLIYTQQDLIISKQHRDWRFWQDYFSDYKASLSFGSLKELADFLISEYNLSELAHVVVTEKINQIDADLIIVDINLTNKAIYFREFTPKVNLNAL